MLPIHDVHISKLDIEIKLEVAHDLLILNLFAEVIYLTHNFPYICTIIAIPAQI